MDKDIKFDYFYGNESENFQFYQIPKVLFKSDPFRKLSSEAKILYSLMLDRTSLSRKNGWIDKKNRVYIIYSNDSIAEDLGCSSGTVTKLKAELNSEKGIGLIEIIRRGLGKPDLIYVKNFSSNKYKTSKKSDENQETQNLDFQNTEHNILNESENKFQDSSLLSSNNTNDIYTNCSNNNLINQSSPDDRMIEKMNIIREKLKDNMDFNDDYYDDETTIQQINEIIEILVEAICLNNYITVSGNKIPNSVFSKRFLKIGKVELDRIINTINNNKKPIKNIKNYILATAYNVPVTYMNNSLSQSCSYNN